MSILSYTAKKKINLKMSMNVTLAPRNYNLIRTYCNL